MLKQVRSGLKGIVAMFGVVLLILSFALWGVPGLSDFVQRPLMRVGQAAVPASLIQTEYNRALQRRRDEAGGKYTPEDAQADGLGDQVVTQIATRSIIEQEAQKLGLVMPRDIVRQFLESDDNFKNPATGKFDDLALQSILRTNNLTAAQFEDILKQDLLRNQLVGSISAGAPAPKAFADALMLRETEMRRIGYLTITDDMSGAPAQPTPDDLKKYYEADKGKFTAPEYRTFSAIVLSPSDFSAGIEPPEAELRRVYDANRARLYESPEKRTVYQTTYKDQAAAAAAAGALRAGKPFEAIAVDNGSTLAASTLTEIVKKDMLDPAVGDAAFASGLAQGAVIGPVKGLFGWTIIQLAGVKPPETRSFEDAKAEIVAQFTEQETKKKLFSAVEALEDARDTGAVLADAAKTVGIDAKTYGPVDAFSFAPGGAIVADIPGDVLAEAFKVNEGDGSEAAELEGGGYFFVQVDEVRAPAAMPYEDVAEEVAQKWRTDERRRRIGAAVRQVTDAVKAGKKLAVAAAPFNRAVLERILSRGQANDLVSPELAEKTFAADLNSVVSGDAGTGGAQTILEIREIGFSTNRLGAGEIASFQQFLGYQLNQEYVEAYLAALRDDYGVKADRERIGQLFNEGQ